MFSPFSAECCQLQSTMGIIAEEKKNYVIFKFVLFVSLGSADSVKEFIILFETSPCVDKLLLS